MAIELIPNQPFIFNAVDQNCLVGDGRKYCQLLNNEDKAGIIFKQSPCGDNVITNSDFTAGVGSELLTNGSFTGSATGWSLSGGATYNSNSILFDIAGANERILQTIAATAGRYYRVVFTITGMTVGTLQLSLGATVQREFTANGTYTQDIYSESTSLQIKSVNSDARLDTVSAKELTISGWSFDNTEYVVAGFGVCHLPGTETNISQAGTLVTATTYQVEITISNRTIGSVFIDFGTGETELFSNGEQIVYITSSGTDAAIRMDSDFDGCIDLILASPLRKDYTFNLFDLNENLIANLDTQGEVFYQDQYVSLNIFFIQGSLLDTNSNPVPYGCYKIGISDPCDSEQLCDPRFNLDSCTGAGSAWALGSGATISAGALHLASDSAGATQDIFLRANTCYNLCLDIQSVTRFVFVKIGSQTFKVSSTGETCIKFNLATDATLIKIFQNPADAAVINSVSIIPCANYLSNCLNWQGEHSCTKKLYAINENLSGFNFSIFDLVIRLRVLSINPSYTQDKEEYLYSSGTRDLTISQSEKYYTLFFDYTDEITHDVINALSNCSTVYIDEVQYTFKKGTYQPEWNKEGTQRLAQSRVEAKLKLQTLFNNKCPR